MCKEVITLPIKGFEGRYTISRDGTVTSVDRYDSLGRRVRARHIKSKKNNRGYTVVNIRKEGSRKTYTLLVHRLVAQAFIPNPENLPEVNHIDEDKSHNYDSNLEWCTSEYNHKYGSRVSRSLKNTDYKKVANKLSRPVKLYDHNYIFIKHFKSQNECAKYLGISVSMLSQVINKNRVLSSGYIIEKEYKEFI